MYILLNCIFPEDSVQTDWDNSDHLRLSLLIFHSAYRGEQQIKT